MKAEGREKEGFVPSFGEGELKGECYVGIPLLSGGQNVISLERRLPKVVPRKNQKGGGGSDGGNGKKVRARWNLSDVNLADGYVDTWGVTLGYSVGSDIGLISSGTNPINDLYCID